MPLDRVFTLLLVVVRQLKFIDSCHISLISCNMLKVSNAPISLQISKSHIIYGCVPTWGGPKIQVCIYHLESRWHNSHVYWFIMAPYKSPPNLGVVPMNPCQLGPSSLILLDMRNWHIFHPTNLIWKYLPGDRVVSLYHPYAFAILVYISTW